jgi:tRNA threonylcarbamoyladenosine biosynthesis protein TsaE
VRRWLTSSPEQTRAVGRQLAAELAPDGVLLLAGPLAAGKTVLAQGVAEGLGIDPAEVSSPTFTLVREHHSQGGELVHFDLYRLERGEVEGLGLEDLLQSPGIKVVEWAERLPWAVPGAVRLRLEIVSSTRRRIDEVLT